jgi:hypothetical protein
VGVTKQIIRCTKCGVLTYASLHMVCPAREKEEHLPEGHPLPQMVEAGPAIPPPVQVDMPPPPLPSYLRMIDDVGYSPAHRQGSQWYGNAAILALHNEGF